MVTAKKRQEFRIKLQKRARRRAEKKIEILEEDKGLKEVRYFRGILIHTFQMCLNDFKDHVFYSFSQILPSHENLSFPN